VPSCLDTLFPVSDIALETRRCEPTSTSADTPAEIVAKATICSSVELSSSASGAVLLPVAAFQIASTALAPTKPAPMETPVRTSRCSIGFMGSAFLTLMCSAELFVVSSGGCDRRVVRVAIFGGPFGGSDFGKFGAFNIYVRQGTVQPFWHVPGSWA